VAIKLAERNKEQPQICDIVGSSNGIYEIRGKFQRTQLKASAKEKENANCELLFIVT
jgi:hypothetical protein